MEEDILDIFDLSEVEDIYCAAPYPLGRVHHI
jgi:hypothetical protein